MPDVTGGKGSFGGSGTAGRDASNTGTGRSSAEKTRQANFERANGFKSGPGNSYTSTSGLSKGITVSPTPQKQQENATRAATYNSAAGKWNQSAKVRSIENLVNNLSPLGLSMQPPDIKRPTTFSEGDYQLGWNPGSLLGIATGAVLPGSGFVTGPIGQGLYSAAGGRNPILTGAGDMGMQTWGDMPSGAPQGQPGTPQGKTDQSGSMAAFGGGMGSTPGGAPFGAQPSAPTQTAAAPADPMAAFFKPKIPNHSLPQGFNSAFPNSLSDADKALLYAKALA